jgi:tyrosyl-tRNA synthetase
MASMRNIIDILEERGLIENKTNEEIRELTKNPIRVYCGFDPTADSLHLGNLVAIMGLAWFQRFGHTPVVILGGATGMIGDPSGRTSERQFLDEETLKTNLLGIRKNFDRVLDFDHPTAKPIMLDNFEWFKEINFIRFLRDYGKLFRLGTMLAKDSVKTRLQSEDGMSYTEFAYQVMQGYDFLHLFDHYQVSVQLGGSDQWGNITAGTELIRKVHGKSAFGLTFPLMTKSDGQKFGKSEKGAVWLSPEKLSPYEFYQYLIRVEDADVIKLMRMLTFMELNEIYDYEKKMLAPDYIPRTAQKRLAQEITRMIHGEDGLKIAIQVTEGVSPGSATKLDVELLEQLSKDIQTYELPLEQVLNKKLIDLLVELNLQQSKGDARRLIRNGGVYINNEKIIDENCSISSDHLIEQRLILLATGKKNKILIRIGESKNPY